MIFVCLVFNTLKQIHLSVNIVKQAELQAFSWRLNLASWDVLKIRSEEHSRCEVPVSHWFSLVSLRKSFCLEVALRNLHTV